MNTEKIRSLYRIGLIVAVVLFLVMLIDHLANDGGLVVLWGILLLIVALAMVVMLFLKPSDEEADAEAEAVEGAEEYTDYKGDIHEVIDVEGIGPKYAEALNNIGIKTTARLCYEDAEEIAQKIDVPVKTVRKWQAMSELAKVNGIGMQYAEALVRSGVQGIQELQDTEPEPMAEKVRAYLESLDNNVLGQKVTPKRIDSWRKKAAKMKPVPQPVPVS